MEVSGAVTNKQPIPLPLAGLCPPLRLRSPVQMGPSHPYCLLPATLGPVDYGAGMGAGVPATVGVPGQDAVIAGAVAGAAGQW